MVRRTEDCFSRGGFDFEAGTVSTLTGKSKTFVKTHLTALIETVVGSLVLDREVQ